MLNPGLLKLASIPLFDPVRQSLEVGAPPVSAGRVTLEVVALRNFKVVEFRCCRTNDAVLPCLVVSELLLCRILQC